MNTRLLLVLLFCLSLLSAFSRPLQAGEGRTIHIVTEEWQPYMGPDQPESGYLSELVKASFERVGYRIRIDFVPWARAVLMVRSGEADALLGAYYTAERAKTLEYSDELAEIRVVLFARKASNIRYTTLESLKGYRIGVVRGAAHSKAFDDASFLHKETFIDLQQSIRMLIADRVALIAGPGDVARSLIRTRFPDYAGQITDLEPALDSNKLYLCFSKRVSDHLTVLNAFNRGVAAIKSDGTLAEIAARHGIRL